MHGNLFKQRIISKLDVTGHLPGSFPQFTALLVALCVDVVAGVERARRGEARHEHAGVEGHQAFGREHITSAPLL
jgi:hypothetical protein